MTATPDFARLATSVGVVRDAENDAAAARQAVTDALTAAGLTPARSPPIRTRVFILPDNNNPGMIETLCMEAVKNEPTLANAYTCVEEPAKAKIFENFLAKSKKPLDKSQRGPGSISLTFDGTKSRRIMAGGISKATISPWRLGTATRAHQSRALPHLSICQFVKEIVVVHRLCRELQRSEVPVEEDTMNRPAEKFPKKNLSWLKMGLDKSQRAPGSILLAFAE